MTLEHGFKRKQFSSIKKEIEQSLVSKLGEINLSPPSIFANIVAIFAEREANLWEQMEAVYNSAYPTSASGYSLDGICALSGVMRRGYTYSEGICQLTALNYTKIPKNSEISAVNSLNNFSLVEDIIVNNENCQSITLEIISAAKANYEIQIGDQVITYKRKAADSKESIARELAVLVEASINEVVVKNEDIQIIITAKDFLVSFACFVGDGIAIAHCSNNASVRATEKGSIAAPIHSLRNIRTPISGWISVDNLSAAKIGNDLESDIDLRARRELSIKLGGSGTLEAIRANLLNLKGVVSASVTENSTNAVDDKGMPPHSFEVLVTGGKTIEIAQLIWQKKPAGISTHGKIGVTIYDSENLPQIINFSRPAIKHIYGQIIITKTSEFNTNSISEMKRKIVQQINKLGVGENIILKSLFVSVFFEKGIASANILLGSSKSEANKPNLTESDIIIKASEVALTDISKIDILLEDF